MAVDKNGMDKWAAEAAKELKGKSPVDLIWQTPEGIAVKPLYTAADLEGLGEDVRRRVIAETGISLQWEIRILGTATPAPLLEASP